MTSRRTIELRERLVQSIGFCVYCGVTAGESYVFKPAHLSRRFRSSVASLELEHVVPLVRGGTDDSANLTLACALCNMRKGKRTAYEFGFNSVPTLGDRKALIALRHDFGDVKNPPLLNCRQ